MTVLKTISDSEVRTQWMDRSLQLQRRHGAMISLWLCRMDMTRLLEKGALPYLAAKNSESLSPVRC